MAPDGAILAFIGDLASRLPPGTVEAIAQRLMGISSAPMDEEFSAILQAGGPSRRSDLERLLTAWFAGGDRTGVMLAWALRSANATAASLRAQERVSVVWSGPAPPLGVIRQTREALLEVIKAARSELWVVSFSGYRLPKVADALRAAAGRGVRVRFVHESPEESDGKVTYSALKALGSELAEVLEVYVWPADRRSPDEEGRTGALHVKCAVADEAKLFVSSANLSPDAMHLNMEMGVLLEGGAGPARAAEHFRWLVQEQFLVRTN